MSFRITASDSVPKTGTQTNVPDLIAQSAQPAQPTQPPQPSVSLQNQVTQLQAQLNQLQAQIKEKETKPPPLQRKISYGISYGSQKK